MGHSHSDLILSDAELAMARYLCDSKAACDKHKRQAMELYTMAHQTDIQEDPQDVMERSCTSKTRYRSPGAAGAAASTAMRERGVTGLRVYPCEFCQGFHLTKESLDTFVAKPRHR